VIATIAGADVGVAWRLALAMLLLQFAIGAANDVADIEPDRIGHPRKPIPSGRITVARARIVFAVSASGGLVLAASVGALALVVAAVGLADGLIYDLRLKGTPISWLPFAAGVALLPVYAWLGATGRLPVAFWAIVPMALAAGAILATTNALSDLDGDIASGVESIATALGRHRSLAVNGVLLVLVQAAAVATTLLAVVPPGALLAEAAGAAAGWAGLGMARASDPRLNRAAWEVQAFGILLLGAGWLAVLSSAGFLGAT
jgi:4-hydroxybenzoate polyprenyltransferase